MYASHPHLSLSWVVLPAAIAIVCALVLPVLAADSAAPKPKKLPLWPDGVPIGDPTTRPATQPATSSITIHRPAPDKANGAAIVICPGGGYGGLVTGAEGHGIADWLVKHGIAGIVLEYRLPHGDCRLPIADARRAIRIARANAKDWGIDPDRIGIMGFSAGGHLASTAATYFDRGSRQAIDPIERASSRPDFTILIYPVITMGQKGHSGSRDNLLGQRASPELIERFCSEKQVTADTPPAFLAHAQDDTMVPPEHSQMFHDALLAKGVACEYLKLPRGGHGLNGYQGPMWDAWQAGSLRWLAQQKLIPASAAATQPAQ